MDRPPLHGRYIIFLVFLVLLYLFIRPDENTVDKQRLIYLSSLIHFTMVLSHFIILHDNSLKILITKKTPQFRKKIRVLNDIDHAP